MLTKRKAGNYETVGNSKCFIPESLPPKNPPLALDKETLQYYGQAMHRLGQLNEMSQRIPNLERFIKAYVMKEALLSSEIEGIHTTLLDIFTPSSPTEKPNKSTQLVLNYTKALDKALAMISKENLPIVSRVFLKAHGILMQEGEGEKASPGSYRKQQVSVGNLIPAPAPQVPKLIADLERFINDDQSILPLIKSALAHVQFETIHPFSDGNGRIGRLLIVLMLVNDSLLEAPLLYPSYYFKKHHAEYYARLDAVRTQGDFEGWVRFYLEAIAESAQDAWRRAKDIELLEDQIRDKITKSKKFNRSNELAFSLLSFLFESPIISVQDAASQLKKTYNTTQSLMKKFVDIDVLGLITEQKRNKLFQFKSYLHLLGRE